MSEVTQSCLTLCDPMDYSPPGSSMEPENSIGYLRGVGNFRKSYGIDHLLKGKGKMGY